MNLKKKLKDNLEMLSEALGITKSFDIILREIEIGGFNAALIMVDGFVQNEVMNRLMDALMAIERPEVVPGKVDKLLRERINWFEIDTVSTTIEVMEQVLAGPVALLVDGEDRAIIIDVRTYPARSINEPELERVTRGARDGFVETVVFNTALIRRRIRDPRLRMEMLQAGERSNTDVAIAYIEDIANPDLVRNVREKIKSVDTDGLPMGAKSLEEYISGRHWNPLPRVRYTERPDVVAAHLLEGHVCIITDTTPVAMIVPAVAWHFTQHAEEYFQNPVVGTYLRWVRGIGILISLLLTPVWLALFTAKPGLPGLLQTIGPKEESAIPVFIQFLLLEIGVDIIRMAFIHTPDELAASLGLVGAVLLGDFAVKVGLFVRETILYTAITVIGSFATPNLEFGLAIRLFRLLLLILTGVLGPAGLGAGLLITLFVFAFSQSFGVPYLWPLIPLDWQALIRIVFRTPVPVVRKRLTKPGSLDPNTGPVGDKEEGE